MKLWPFAVLGLLGRRVLRPRHPGDGHVGVGAGVTPELRATIDRLPDDLRETIRALIEEGERARTAALFEDMGYDECDTCRQARLRTSFTLPVKTGAT